jgi:hypothetical protein
MPWLYRLIDEETREHVNTIRIGNHDAMVEMMDIAETLGFYLEFDHFNDEDWGDVELTDKGKEVVEKSM